MPQLIKQKIIKTDWKKTDIGNLSHKLGKDKAESSNPSFAPKKLVF